jgi:hypothetical protein
MRVITGAILVLAAASLTAASLTGCGTVSARPAGDPSPIPGELGSAAPGIAAPPAGNRAQADALARLLLSRLRLPAGTRRLPATPAPPFLSQPAYQAAGAKVDDHRFFAVAEPPGALSSYLVAHVPDGMTSFGTGQLSGPGEPTTLDVGYQARPVPAGIYQAQVVLTMVPDGSGGSRLRADAQVIWYPSRTAAEYVDPARYHVLTMTVSVGGRKMRTIHKVVTSQADIAGLADALDRSPAEPPVFISCPAIFVTYQLALSVSRHTRPAVVIFANSISCGGTAITVDGRPQPGLADDGAVAAAAARALGYTPKPVL